MKTLHLSLKKEWFDMICVGKKQHEYRKINDYWCRRLLNNISGDYIEINVWNELIYDLNHSDKRHDNVEQCMKYFGVEFKKFNDVKFTNGYGNTRSSIYCYIDKITIGFGHIAWGAPRDSRCFIIHLGDKI